MLTIGTDLFVQLPSQSNDRHLQRGTVVESRDHTLTATFDLDLAVEPGQEVLIYFERRGKFMKQSARIDAVMREGNKPVVGIQAVGSPVSAEGRQCYRASTVMSQLVARVDDQDNCPLLDVSVTGLAVVVSKPYNVGQVLSITLTHEGKVYKGRASVQSIRAMGQDCTRYGMHCVDEKDGGNLRQGLQQVSMSVQRLQARRLAGRA